MIVTIAFPLEVVHAKSVHEHDDVAPGVGKRRGQRGAIEDHGRPGDTDVHGDGQRIAGRDQVVAEDAVERGHDDLALR
jgi:hypothetical protein